MLGPRQLRALLAFTALLAVLLLAVLRSRPEQGRTELARTWPVMGTFLQVRVFAEDSAAARAALAAAQHAVFRVDTLMSTWQPGSEISRLNAQSGSGTWQPLSGETLTVLLAARRYSEASGGAFDISVGPLMEAWGFRSERPGPPSGAALDSARARVDYRALEIDSAGSRARLLRAGMAVDLGAIAKGYALDLGAAAARAAGATAALLDLGGNVFGFGTPPAGADQGWRVGILDPADPAGTLGTIALDSGSVATSGDYEQFFEYDGIRYSHIMDARRGEPARGVAQVTVAAPSGMQADALSTVLFVLGPEAGRALLAGPLGRGAAALWVPDPAAPPVLAGTDTARFRLP